MLFAAPDNTGFRRRPVRVRPSVQEEELIGRSCRFCRRKSVRRCKRVGKATAKAAAAAVRADRGRQAGAKWPDQAFWGTQKLSLAAANNS